MTFRLCRGRLDDADVAADRLDELGVVGRRASRSPSRAPRERTRLEDLRRLHGPERAPLERPDHAPAGVGLLDRVDGPRGRDDAVAAPVLEPLDAAVEQLRRRQRARRVVDHELVGPRRASRARCATDSERVAPPVATVTGSPGDASLAIAAISSSCPGGAAITARVDLLGASSAARHQAIIGLPGELARAPWVRPAPGARRRRAAATSAVAI